MAKYPVIYGALSLIPPHVKVPCHLSPLMAMCPVTYLPSWQSALSLTVLCHLSPFMARCPVTYLSSCQGALSLISPHGKVPCHIRCPLSYLPSWQGALSLTVPCHLSLLMARCLVSYLPSWQGALSLTVPCQLSPLMARCPVTYGALSPISPHGKVPCHLSPLLERACFSSWRPSRGGSIPILLVASVRYYHSALLRSNKVEGIKPERDTNGHLLPLKRGPSPLTPSLKHPTPYKARPPPPPPLPHIHIFAWEDIGSASSRILYFGYSTNSISPNVVLFIAVAVFGVIFGYGYRPTSPKSSPFMSKLGRNVAPRLIRTV